MSLKLIYMGQNDGQTYPDVTLTGDPGTDQQTLSAAGYFGGVIVNLKAVPTYTYPGQSEAIVPCDGDVAGRNPYGSLLNGPGEFSGAIGPSGSKKAPVVRAMWAGIVDFQAYDAAATFAVGDYLYCGGTISASVGKFTSLARKGTNTTAIVGICTHVPTVAEPWLGVASLI